ncbi:peptidase S41-like protein [Mucilaginibacter yixingensis]|uniref:Peptidase S41-like protein n=1 Tax=Mucilaginibacter yixingensis TaxID=1295612 RepID=A0A2T5J5W0_9SPHI|nr:S41 family peptidase [Mucilaginibacter yixingensis]PTQ93572.1 peptidase S41-like protein [Mucilaginibacter yixingensis]
MKKVLLCICMGLFLFSACSKKKSDPTPDSSNTPPADGSTLDKIRDSVFLYAKEDYYWYDALPSYVNFNPRGYTSTTSDLDALTKELNAISQLKINPATGQPYEYYSLSPGQAKYSFIDEGQASGKLNAVTGDFGFAPLYASTNDLRIKYVYPGSPAGLAGLRRGDQITAINGRTSLSYDGNTTSTNVNFVINAYAYSSTISMTLQRVDASNNVTTFSVSLNAASYTINPILATKTITVNASKKVGYIMFNSFVNLTNVQTALSTAFSSFAGSGITDLVVDLRYNGGGYVETAIYLDNLIAPSSANGQLMFNTYYNSNLTSGNTAMLKNQVRTNTQGTYNLSQVDYTLASQYNKVTFGKVGSLNNLQHVFFIVTGSTASAAELTINNLRPYMNVQLIGSTTYGKPVGFFEIDINKYQMYIPEFETKNASNQGGYFTGMVPGSADYPGKVATDDPTHDFGDVNENLLKQAINFVTNGTYATDNLAIQSTGGVTFTLTDQDNFVKRDNVRKFNGMVMQNLKLKQ